MNIFPFAQVILGKAKEVLNGIDVTQEQEKLAKSGFRDATRLVEQTTPSNLSCSGDGTAHSALVR